VLGGSSAINGAVAIRGRPQDFRNWNLPGWSYDDLLPSFKMLEDSASGDARLHGKGGPFPARQMTREDITPRLRAFVDATMANGFRLVEDFDAPTWTASGPYLMNIVNGVR
jgi:choline dehydrogenase